MVFLHIMRPLFTQFTQTMQPIHSIMLAVLCLCGLYIYHPNFLFIRLLVLEVADSKKKKIFPIREDIHIGIYTYTYIQYKEMYRYFF